jgi:uncharacterized protein (TIGR02646 family)
MIKIERPLEVPMVLQTQGSVANAANGDLYINDTNAYDTGEKTFVFQNNIYGDNSVKNSLKAAQHNKCCYCESDPDATSYGAVEHYRPKGTVVAFRQGNKIYPGYFWLAYEWSNLLFICERCNTNKGSYFPLADASPHSRDHNQPLINGESPLFINPISDEPSTHIAFRNDAIYGLTVQGKTTIDYLKLDSRDGLINARLKDFRLLEAYVETARRVYGDANYIDLYEDALRYIRKKLLVSGEYSAMAKAYINRFLNDPAFATLT